MSPGPAVVPVERYIGSCLISSSAGYSKKDRYRYPCLPEFYPSVTAGWGVPLVGPPPPAVHRRPSVKIKDVVKEERSPLSRLAIHTQGAPLIQAQRQSQPRKASKPQQPKPPAPPQQPSTSSQEESPNENSLPRIIKPRKRRKKDRKPQLPPPVVSESAIVTLKPYTPLCQEYEINSSSVPAIEESPPTPRKIEQPIPETALTDSDVVNCCCRYCDPAGTVWESPQSSSSSSSSSVSAEWSTLQVSSEIITSPNGHRDIEIKFFSSPPPQQHHQHAPATHQRPISVTPPWQ